MEVLRSELTGSNIMVIVNDRVADSWDVKLLSPRLRLVTLLAVA